MKDAGIFRIFISSPGDVAEERRMVREALQRLNKDAFVRGQIAIDVVTWDDPEGPSAVVANLSPQVALARNLTRPRDCDLTIVIFGRRFGTRLSPELVKPDGSRYSSGTEWEFDDAIAGRRDVLVYKRNEASEGDSPAEPDALEQEEKLRAFLDRFRNTDGSLNAGLNVYQNAEDLREKVLHHTRQLVLRFLRDRQGSRRARLLRVFGSIGIACAAALLTFSVARSLAVPPELVEEWLWKELVPTVKDLAGDGDELSTAWMAYLEGQPRDAVELGKQYKAMNRSIAKYTATRDRYQGLRGQYWTRLDSIRGRREDLHLAIQTVLSAAEQAFPEVPGLNIDEAPVGVQIQRARRQGAAFNAEFSEHLFSLRGEVGRLENKMIESAGHRLPACWEGAQ